MLSANSIDSDKTAQNVHSAMSLYCLYFLHVLAHMFVSAHDWLAVN